MTPSAGSETPHTTTPWRVCGGMTPAYITIDSPDGYIIFGMADHASHWEGMKLIKAPSYEAQRANAALIVTAVNCHADLLAACETIEQAWNDRPAGTAWGSLIDAVKLARAAIRKTKWTP